MPVSLAKVLGAQTENTPHFVPYMVSIHSRVPASIQFGTHNHKHYRNAIYSWGGAVATEWIGRRIGK